MRVKRFVGINVADAMGKIKKELGPEAVILQTRQVKEGGFLGFFAKTKVEITAAIEDKPAQANVVVEEAKYNVNNEDIKRAYDAYIEKENEFAREPNKETNVEQVETLDTNSELKEMHNILLELKSHITRKEYKEIIPETFGRWPKFLMERGISEELSTSIVNNLKNYLTEEQWQKDDIIYEKIKNEIIKFCTNTEKIKPRKNKSLVVALVGPTGVGKTTTIGKLAAGFSIIERRKVALITADTYRVAAVEQLKTFGEIIGVPVEVVMTPSNLQEAIQRHKDKELVFIDTAGRSPHHDIHMSELEEFLQKGKPDLTMLVMSVTTNLHDQISVFEKFKEISTHLIFTKLDESYHTGSLLNLIARTSLPIAYLTNGQNVPDDIDAATPEKLARCVLGEGKPNV